MFSENLVKGISWVDVWTQYKRDWKKVPNIITMIGFLAAILMAILRIFCGLANAFTLSLTILVPVTDYWDGFFARLLKQKTKIGAGFDKLRDKVYSLTCFSVSFFSYLPAAITGTVEAIAVLFLLLFNAASELILFKLGALRYQYDPSEVDATKWGQAKMWAQSIYSISWALIYDLRPQGMLITDQISLRWAIFTLSIALFLAIASIAGNYRKLMAAKKKYVAIAQPVSI